MLYRQRVSGRIGTLTRVHPGPVGIIQSGCLRVSLLPVALTRLAILFRLGRVAGRAV